MRRCLSHLSVLLPILVFVAAAMMWVRADFIACDVLTRSDLDYPQATTRDDELRTERGELCYLYERRTYLSQAALDEVFRPDYRLPRHTRWLYSNHKPIQIDPRTKFFGRLGFQANGMEGGTNPGKYRLQYCVVCLPFWLFMALSLPVPLLAWWRVRARAKRRKAGLCERCGYDLRASSERCPECGATSARSSADPSPR